MLRVGSRSKLLMLGFCATRPRREGVRSSEEGLELWLVDMLRDGVMGLFEEMCDEDIL